MGGGSSSHRRVRPLNDDQTSVVAPPRGIEATPGRASVHNTATPALSGTDDAVAVRCFAWGGGSRVAGGGGGHAPLSPPHSLAGDGAENVPRMIVGGADGGRPVTGLVPYSLAMNVEQRQLALPWIFIFHDAENLTMLPAEGRAVNGVALIENVINEVLYACGTLAPGQPPLQCFGAGGQLHRLFQWNLFIPRERVGEVKRYSNGKPVKRNGFHPSELLLDELRTLRVQVVDAGTKKDGVDAAIKRGIEDLHTLREQPPPPPPGPRGRPPASAPAVIVALLSGDSDFTDDVRDLQAKNYHVCALYNSKPETERGPNSGKLRALLDVVDFKSGRWAELVRRSLGETSQSQPRPLPPPPPPQQQQQQQPRPQPPPQPRPHQPPQRRPKQPPQPRPQPPPLLVGSPTQNADPGRLSNQDASDWLVCIAASLLPPGATAAAGQEGAGVVQVPWTPFSDAVCIEEKRLNARGQVPPCGAKASSPEKVERFCRERLAVIWDGERPTPSFARFLRPSTSQCHPSPLAPAGQGPLSEQELGDFYVSIASSLLPRDADPQLLKWDLFLKVCREGEIIK